MPSHAMLREGAVEARPAKAPSSWHAMIRIDGEPDVMGTLTALDAEDAGRRGRLYGRALWAGAAAASGGIGKALPRRRDWETDVEQSFDSPALLNFSLRPRLVREVRALKGKRLLLSQAKADDLSRQAMLADPAVRAVLGGRLARQVVTEVTRYDRESAASSFHAYLPLGDGAPEDAIGLLLAPETVAALTAIGGNRAFDPKRGTGLLEDAEVDLAPPSATLAAAQLRAPPETEGLRAFLAAIGLPSVAAKIEILSKRPPVRPIPFAPRTRP